MVEVLVNGLNPERVMKFLADNSIVATVEDRGARGIYVVGDFDPTPLLTYTDDYVPVEVSSHLQHLRDFRNTVRQGGTPPSLAQTQHVIADIIDALRLLDARLEREA